MHWVLNTYETAQDWPLERIIEICKATGYEGIEFLQDFNQAHGLEASASDDHILSVKRKMAGAGQIVSSLTSCRKFDSPDDEERKCSVRQVKRVIDQAELLGCNHVRVLGDQVPDDDAGRERVLHAVGEALHDLGLYAQSKGINLSIEAHGSFTDPIYATTVVKSANLPNVGIVFNSQWRVGAQKGWSLPAGAQSIAPLYDLVGPYLTSVHTHEMEHPAVIGYYRELFRLLVRDGYPGYVSNECAYRGPDPEKVLRLYTALFQSFVG